MFQLIFVIVVAAGITALIIGVQKNKKKGAEPEVSPTAKEVKLEVVPVATAEQQADLAASKAANKPKKLTLAADKAPKAAAPKSKAAKPKSKK